MTTSTINFTRNSLKYELENKECKAQEKVNSMTDSRKFNMSFPTPSTSETYITVMLKL